MEKFIEIIAYYFIDWQQTAIANTRYSVVLIAAAIFIGALIMFLLKRNSLNALNQSLEREKDSFQQVEKKNAELLNKEKDLSQQIEALQRQIEQVTVKSKQENAEHHAVIKKNEDQYRQALDTKEVELTKIQSTVKDKDQANAQLQVELEEKKSQLSQHALEQEKFVEIEKEYSQLSGEFKGVKDQLVQQEIELNDKKTQVDQLQKAAKSNDTTDPRIAELEAELEKNSVSDDSAALQQQLVDLETELTRLQKVNETIESSPEVSSELETSMLEQNEKLAQYNEKLESLLKIEPDANEDAFAADSAKKSEGFMSKVKDMISSLDEVDISDKSQFRNANVEEDAWSKYQRLMDQFIDNFTDEEESQSDGNNETKANIEEIPAIEDEIEQVAEESSGTFDDVVEKIDSLQDKVLGIYRKIRS